MADEDPQTTPGRSRKKLLAVGAAAAVLVIGGGLGAFLMLGGEDAAVADAPAAAPAAARAEAVYVNLAPEFVVNFRDKNQRAKFLKVEIAVETHDADVEEAVVRHMPAIRNSLVLLLSRQVYDDLVPHEGKEQLRQMALAEVQQVLTAQTGEPGVDNLYFSNFVMH